MTVASETVVEFSSRFARAFPELAVPWHAAEFPDARLLVLNEPLAVELGLDPTALRAGNGVGLLTGNRLPASAMPVAQAYAGHQFGGYSPVLGDGRALLLGEIATPDGRLRDLHLKGSGRTPFARGGDGLAAIGPMLREFLISEAMHALGVPTTRALAVTTTGVPVQRETVLPGAVLARVAASHLRVGTFQYAAAAGGDDLVRRLVAAALERHYPHLADADNPSLSLLEAVVHAQASLIARWVLVGFVHGVMNTDNMTISGETIDYGPCAFMEAFDPASVYSSIDLQGRYAFGRQSRIGEWNLARLAEALLPTIDADTDRAVELAQNALSRYADAFNAAWSEGMRVKLGTPADADEAVTTALSTDLVSLLQIGRVDYTGFFRRLAGGAKRGRRTSCSRTPSRSTCGHSGGWPSARMLRRWMPATRCTSRAITWWKRRWMRPPPVTSSRSRACWPWSDHPSSSERGGSVSRGRPRTASGRTGPSAAPERIRRDAPASAGAAPYR